MRRSGAGAPELRSLGTRVLAGETRSDARVASEGLRATEKKRAAYRRARACPSPCCGPPKTRGGQAPALRAKAGFSAMRRSGAGAPELRSLGTRVLAGETRSDARVASEGLRATEKKRAAYRRARACPSPCCGPPKTRGGQAPALRAKRGSPSCAVREQVLPNYSHWARGRSLRAKKGFAFGRAKITRQLRT